MVIPSSAASSTTPTITSDYITLVRSQTHHDVNRLTTPHQLTHQTFSQNDVTTVNLTRTISLPSLFTHPNAVNRSVECYHTCDTLPQHRTQLNSATSPWFTLQKELSSVCLLECFLAAYTPSTSVSPKNGHTCEHFTVTIITVF